LSSFPEVSEKAVPFVTGNFREFKPEFFIEWKAPQVEVVEVKVKRFPHLSYWWQCFLFVLCISDAATQYPTAEIICNNKIFSRMSNMDLAK